MLDSSSRFDTIPDCDGQTDEQTDRRTDVLTVDDSIYRANIASRVKKTTSKGVAPTTLATLSS